MEPEKAEISHHVVRSLANIPTWSLHISLWTSLRNASFLRHQLLEGNTDFEYAFLDARMILSETHLLAACFRALRDLESGRLKSKNVHSEIVFAMGGGNNIGEAFRTFGIQNSTTSLVVIKVFRTPNPIPDDDSQLQPAATEPAQAITTHLTTSIEATSTPPTHLNLSKTSHLEKIRKTYKLPPLTTKPAKPAKPGIIATGVDGDGDGQGENEDEDQIQKKEQERERKEEIKILERAALGAIALRGAT